MKFIIPTLVIAMAVTPAMAQGKGRGPRDEAKTDPKAGAKKKADEEAYQRALKTIPEPKTKVDPWQGSR